MNKKVYLTFAFFIFLIIGITMWTLNPEPDTMGEKLTQKTKQIYQNVFNPPDFKTDDIFISLDENYNSLTYGEAIFTIKNPSPNPINIKEALSFRFVELKNSIESYEILIQETKTTQVLFDNYTFDCSKKKYVKNETFDGEKEQCEKTNNQFTKDITTSRS